MTATDGPHSNAPTPQVPGAPIDLTGGPGTRLERDALGPRALPIEARYGIHTLRAVEALGVSRHRLGEYPDLIAALGATKQAAARANADAGALNAATATMIDVAAARLTAVDPALLPDLITDLLGGGGSIGVHMNVNEVIANVANLAQGRPFGAYDPVAPKTHVSASQSTADVCHTASRLAILTAAGRLDAVLGGLISTIGRTSRQLTGVTTLGRTCLQDALAVPANLLFEGAAAALTRRRIGLASVIEPLAGVTLGGTVVGTGAGAPERYRERVVPHLCAVTGRNLFLHPHRGSALQHSDDLVAVAGALVGIASVAAKLAQDLRLLGSGPNGGFGEVLVPHVMEGSSFFGDKRNPVVAETVLAVAAQVHGHDAAVRAAAMRAELHLQVFDHVAVVNVLDATQLLEGALERFDRLCLRTLLVDADRAEALAAAAFDPTMPTTPTAPQAHARSHGAVDDAPTTSPPQTPTPSGATDPQADPPTKPLGTKATR